MPRLGRAALGHALASRVLTQLVLSAPQQPRQRGRSTKPKAPAAQQGHARTSRPPDQLPAHTFEHRQDESNVPLVQGRERVGLAAGGRDLVRSRWRSRLTRPDEPHRLRDRGEANEQFGVLLIPLVQPHASRLEDRWSYTRSLRPGVNRPERSRRQPESSTRARNACSAWAQGPGASRWTSCPASGMVRSAASGSWAASSVPCSAVK